MNVFHDLETIKPSDIEQMTIDELEQYNKNAEDEKNTENFKSMLTQVITICMESNTEIQKKCTENNITVEDMADLVVEDYQKLLQRCIKAKKRNEYLRNYYLTHNGKNRRRYKTRENG